MYFKNAMQRSPLKTKSEMMQSAAQLLHDKDWYPCVAHAAYYSCYQLLLEVWLHTMNKTQAELDTGCKSNLSLGSHEYLLNQIAVFIETKDKKDSRLLRNEMPQLKKLRVKADYKNEEFLRPDSSKSLTISNKLIPILKKY